MLSNQTKHWLPSVDVNTMTQLTPVQHIGTGSHTCTLWYIDTHLFINFFLVLLILFQHLLSFLMTEINNCSTEMLQCYDCFRKIHTDASLGHKIRSTIKIQRSKYIKVLTISYFDMHITQNSKSDIFLQLISFFIKLVLFYSKKS